MKKIAYKYGVELDWVAALASGLDGRIKDNFIIVPEHIHTGDSYFLSCAAGISVLYSDVLHHSEIHLRKENSTDDFIGLYYNLAEDESVLVADNIAKTIGKWSCNLAIIDSAYLDYIVRPPGTRTFALCIFIKKDRIREYFQKNPSLKNHSDEIFNPNLNRITKFRRMSNKSCQLLLHLRSKEVGGVFFDFHLRNTVQCLLIDYIKEMTFGKNISDKRSNTSVKQKEKDVFSMYNF